MLTNSPNTDTDPNPSTNPSLPPEFLTRAEFAAEFGSLMAQVEAQEARIAALEPKKPETAEKAEKAPSPWVTRGKWAAATIAVVGVGVGGYRYATRGSRRSADLLRAHADGQAALAALAQAQA